jgi:hypothetical protein
VSTGSQNLPVDLINSDKQLASLKNEKQTQIAHFAEFTE